MLMYYSPQALLYNELQVHSPEKMPRAIQIFTRKAGPTVLGRNPTTSFLNRKNFNIRHWSWSYRGCWHQTCCRNHMGVSRRSCCLSETKACDDGRLMCTYPSSQITLKIMHKSTSLCTTVNVFKVSLRSEICLSLPSDIRNYLEEGGEYCSQLKLLIGHDHHSKRWMPRRHAVEELGTNF